MKKLDIVNYNSNKAYHFIDTTHHINKFFKIISIKLKTKIRNSYFNYLHKKNLYKLMIKRKKFSYYLYT